MIKRYLLIMIDHENDNEPILLTEGNELEPDALTDEEQILEDIYKYMGSPSDNYDDDDDEKYYYTNTMTEISKDVSKAIKEYWEAINSLQFYTFDVLHVNEFSFYVLVREMDQ